MLMLSVNFSGYWIPSYLLHMVLRTKRQK